MGSRIHPATEHINQRKQGNHAKVEAMNLSTGSICSFPLAGCRKNACTSRIRRSHPVRCLSRQRDACGSSEKRESEGLVIPRRTLCSLCGALAVASITDVSAGPAGAVQGYTAGRIPGLTENPDSEGFYTYTRPEGKSGGHGVGWSEIPRYTFRVPEGWREEPVSIADPGGTEIDLRFGNSAQGELFVVVAPVLRFLDVGFNANVRIDEVGPPRKLIVGFGPEIFGRPVEDEDVISTKIIEKGPLMYYQWEVKPHHLVSATAVRNRVFILGTGSNSRQWRKGESALRTIQESFSVPDEVL